MASTDNGKQIITFKYQQEGTAEGFNKLLSGVIPTGIILGGELTKVDDSTVNIGKMQMMIGDGNVVVHVQTTEMATVSVSPSQPYVIATFNWANLVNNYVTFEASALNTLPSTQNAIIVGRCVFSGTNMHSSFDYTRRTWSSTYLNNDFQFDNSYKTKSPSFNVTSIEGGLNIIGFNVGVGRGIIGGKEVVISNDFQVSLSNDVDAQDTYHYINTSVNNGRIDIAVLMSDGSVRYIMGIDSPNPTVPSYPSNGLAIAKFTYSAGRIITEIFGYDITNIYNNNYLGFTPTVGEVRGNNYNYKPHTLFL